MSNIQSLKSGLMSDDAMTKIDNELKNSGFHSEFYVFKDHCGFIKGEVHTFIGAKGAGKSTYAKTILSELLYSEKEVFLYISEETTEKYLHVLNRAMRIAVPDKEKREEMLERLVVFSEFESDIKNPKELFNYLKEIMEFGEIDIFIFDNFTTSFLSEIQINLQSEALRGFKKMAVAMNIPVLMFFHTGKNTDSTKLNGDNVRGSATAINIGSYNYLITQIKTEGNIVRNFIYTEKARYHPAANKHIYEMIWHFRSGLFIDCKHYTMDDYKALLVQNVNKTKKKEDQKWD